MSPTAVLEVLSAGPLTTIQDLGRPGHAAWGVGASGAADRRSLRLANRLVGNAEHAAALEVVLGGLHLCAHRAVILALTGARCDATVDGRPVGHNSVLSLRRGQVLRLRTPATGLRTYVAVRGGIDVEPVLGSRSTDVLSGLGPAVVAAGSLLPVGAPPPAFPNVDFAPVPDPPHDEVTLQVTLGPRDDWFTPEARDALLRTSWTVTPDSNRVGMRLSGTALARAVCGELPSEGMVRGALQVPPTGLPTLFLSDHPVTGGYPVIAVVVDADVDRAAQLRPGQTLRFRTIHQPRTR
ncbi:biotin-dependent carboxyltransferase family protein [Planosporangium flavigriseum]|uniref:Allophanate hydrolase n=1 Tax=Planosporangium flavigriseum TaxID=373681 RepID=A0A8J3LQU3_9ACTN|nr:biotin-dependent carboxyltransferase family protein [Planosporangium flavigriseum]NJC66168.1 biotin-dependent carboxyltransferase family protein [Planosporangium flavigriseum]GIG75140.1 allophanate hydrolase [Planosporangium flavigriseum]